MDLYRLNSIEEVQDIGVFEYLDSGHYCFIEWPELIFPYLDSTFIEINLNIMENNNRNIIFLNH
jgi:tRNA threonylcarbamoyladenosine biosynthesis protein TsaE